jgi:hypothetical protein
MIFIETRNSKCGTIETLAAQINGRLFPSVSISFRISSKSFFSCAVSGICDIINKTIHEDV